MQYKDLVDNPIGVLLQLFGAKWKLLIIQALLKKDMRFLEIKKVIGCTSKVLTACLRELEEDGIVIRECSSTLPLRVNYCLTDIGYTLRPVLESMQKWGKEYKKLRKLMEKYNQDNVQ